jgi:hypothetical protein
MGSGRYQDISSHFAREQMVLECGSWRCSLQYKVFFGVKDCVHFGRPSLLDGGLERLVKIELFQEQDKKTIMSLWINHHRSRNCISAVIDGAKFNELRQRAVKWYVHYPSRLIQLQVPCLSSQFQSKPDF